ncbi:hypothetical protein V2J09_003673 [Rumex salicifolius]
MAKSVTAPENIRNILDHIEGFPAYRALQSFISARSRACVVMDLVRFGRLRREAREEGEVSLFHSDHSRWRKERIVDPHFSVVDRPPT